MTNKEAIDELNTIKVVYSNMRKEYLTCVEALDTAIEALKLEQRILDNGYTGKEAEFRIGGRLFGIREKAQ